MTQKLKVSNVELKQSSLIVLLEENQLSLTKDIMAEGRMLADSDNLSFIYILDSSEDFIYISFPKQVWTVLNEGQNLPVILKLSDKDTIELINFQDELQYLITNIDGNSNYGEEMVSAVSEAFSV